MYAIGRTCDSNVQAPVYPLFLCGVRTQDVGYPLNLRFPRENTLVCSIYVYMFILRSHERESQSSLVCPPEL